MSPEVCEVSLYVQVQDGGWSGGAQRRAVLAQQVLELLADLPDGQTEGGAREGGVGGEGLTICLQHHRRNLCLFFLLHPSSSSAAAPSFAFFKPIFATSVPTQQ